MARTNTPIKREKVYTYEGGRALQINAEQALRRTVMASLLWEDGFYEEGKVVTDRIAELIPKVRPEVVAQIAIDARDKMYLRHMPLFIVREMARSENHRSYVADTLAHVIQRPDELAEFLSIYWSELKYQEENSLASLCTKSHVGQWVRISNRQILSAQVKRGLARAFVKFDEYQLKKYNRDNAIKLRDVLFLCHAKPLNDEQAEMWKRLIDDNLTKAGTWEEDLSSGTEKKTEEDKRTIWEGKLKSGKLGDLALLRNLRNMHEAGVNESLVRQAMQKAQFRRVLPFRFTAAANTNPWYEPMIEEAMLRKMDSYSKLPGHTVLLVDVSGSMDVALSSKSDLTGVDAACALAVFLRELCDKVDIFTFSNSLVRVPARRGFALAEACSKSQHHGRTYLGYAVKALYQGKHEMLGGISFRGQDLNPDRLIVITDEQAHDDVDIPQGTRGYMINVANYRNGVGYQKWLHIDGWSEAVIDYICRLEQEELY